MSPDIGVRGGCVVACRSGEGVGSGVRDLLLDRLRHLRRVRQGADHRGDVAAAGVLGACGRRDAGPGAGDGRAAVAGRRGRTPAVAVAAAVRPAGGGGLPVPLLRGGLAAAGRGRDPAGVHRAGPGRGLDPFRAAHGAAAFGGVRCRHRPARAVVRGGGVVGPAPGPARRAGRAGRGGLPGELLPARRPGEWPDRPAGHDRHRILRGDGRAGGPRPAVGASPGACSPAESRSATTPRRAGPW